MNNNLETPIYMTDGLLKSDVLHGDDESMFNFAKLLNACQTKELTMSQCLIFVSQQFSISQALSLIIINNH